MIITREQLFEVGATGAEHHLVGPERLASGREGHVHKVLILQETFEGVSERGLVIIPLEAKLVRRHG